VVKVPRFAFEKFTEADPRLTTTMKSVGEAMAIGRSFPEALQKALRSVEKKGTSFSWEAEGEPLDDLVEKIATPTEWRLQQVQRAMWLGLTIDQAHSLTKIDPWFLSQIEVINQYADHLRTCGELTKDALSDAKGLGFSDQQIAQLRNVSEAAIRAERDRLNIHPVFKTVDTCAAEFQAHTPYHYSSYDLETEVEPRTKPAVIILGSGPNRIGQGLEFDYSCVHAAFALRAAGYETVMINCNPETVSTDYDTSDRLYFEPLTLEDVLEVIRAESQAGPVLGVIAQLGGQTPLGLARGLTEAGVTILGTSPDAIDLAEDRGQFGQILKDNALTSPEYGMARSYEEAVAVAARITYPVLVRPSFVLGGRGMEIVYDDESLKEFIEKATLITPNQPVLIDRFLDDAIEIDVDALFDGDELFLAGVMEHIEEAGIHSGDSACVLPSFSISADKLVEVRAATEKIARGVGVRGLINIQFAISRSDSDHTLYVLEANPRASRTVPFVSKATGVALSKAASLIAMGNTIASLRESGLLPASGDAIATGVSVKEAVLPWNRFRRSDGTGVDAVLGPEMRSTGEVMGIAETFGEAYFKSQIASFGTLPQSGNVFISLSARDKAGSVEPAKALSALGFTIYATKGTQELLAKNGVQSTLVRKNSEPGDGLSAVDMINTAMIDLVVNTPLGRGTRHDGWLIRTASVQRGIPIITTIAGLRAAVSGITQMRSHEMSVMSLQNWHKKLVNK
jgi:carbamoyl-phosphate synthase large subunit